jgi:hypothetical protein
MSFSADKVNILKGGFSQRRFSSSKDPSESGEFSQLLFFFRGEGALRHGLEALSADFWYLEAWESFRTLEI